MKLKNVVLAVAAALEVATGVALIAYPPIVVQLLFGVDIDGIGIIILMGRLTGIALVGLGVACWPRSAAFQQLYGMLTYGTLVMLYLARIGIRGAPVGMLLWPAVAAHAILSALLVVARFKKTPTA